MQVQAVRFGWKIIVCLLIEAVKTVYKFIAPAPIASQLARFSLR